MFASYCIRYIHSRYASVLFSGPESDMRPRAVRSSACQEHANLHKRLDVVEKVLSPNQPHIQPSVVWNHQDSGGFFPPVSDSLLNVSFFPNSYFQNILSISFRGQDVEIAIAHCHIQPHLLCKIRHDFSTFSKTLMSYCKSPHSSHLTNPRPWHYLTSCFGPLYYSYE